MTERDDEEDPDLDATQREASPVPAPTEPAGQAPPAIVASRRGAERDDDSPESVRLTFVLLTALAACICVLPRQWVSAAILGVASVALFVWHVVDKRRLAKRA